MPLQLTVKNLECPVSFHYVFGGLRCDEYFVRENKNSLWNLQWFLATLLLQDMYVGIDYFNFNL